MITDMLKQEFNETILTNGEYFTSLLNDIRNANTSINFETYIFNSDTAGKMLADELCQAAKRGVKIRVLVDGIGTPDWGSDMTIKIENAGIETRIYHPIPFFISHWQRHHQPTSFISKLFHLFTAINSRNHRKSCVIDHRIAYVGSANITNHLLTESNDIWRETSVKIANINTSQLLYAFEKAWSHSKPKFISGSGIFLLNYNWKLRRSYYKSLIKHINECKSRLYVTNAYFSPSNHLLKRLIKAKRRGVDVKILLPQASDVMIMPFAAKTFYWQLLKGGVEIYEYLPCILHAKSLIIDDWYLVGSSNLDHRSLIHDLEVNVEISKIEAKKFLDELFLNDISQSKKVHLEDVKKQPWYEYLFGRFVLFFRYII